MSKFSRATLINQLESSQIWDVIIIGGGATGLGIALDSATRGYKTLLLEQVDFAKGTSSRSTKLVHGGVRYLAQGNIGLVREALFERGLLMKNAPHLVTDQIFIIPAYSLYDSLLYTVGLKFYDILAGKLSFGKSLRIKKKETTSRLSTLKSSKLRGGIVYHDGQFDDSRLAINLAQTCIENGGTVLNHFMVTGLTKNDKGNIIGVQAKDMETKKHYRLISNVVINATGVFADDILFMDNPDARKTIRPSQGIHLILDKSFMPGPDALMIPKTDDGRVLFIVPWQNKLVVGTTDTLVDEHNLEPKALEDEIEFILSTANRYLLKKVTRNDILSIFAGLRPLAAPKGKNEKTKEISRSHKIFVSDSGLISIIGGKWTTYRRMAQDTIDKSIDLGYLTKRNCRTKNLAVHGAIKQNNHKTHLTLYGSDQEGLKSLIDTDPVLGEKLHPKYEFLKAEVVWSVRNEMARTLDDVLARRVRILFHDARAAIDVAPVVAEIMAKELKQDKLWQNNQIDIFNLIAQKYIL